MDTSWIPVEIWQLPMPMTVIILLSLGVFVTKREHHNMTIMMEYFKTLSETKDATIETQAEALGEHKETAILLKEVLETVRHLAKESRE